MIDNISILKHSKHIKDKSLHVNSTRGDREIKNKYFLTLG